MTGLELLIWLVALFMALVFVNRWNAPSDASPWTSVLVRTAKQALTIIIATGLVMAALVLYKLLGLFIAGLWP